MEGSLEDFSKEIAVEVTTEDKGELELKESINTKVTIKDRSKEQHILSALEVSKEAATMLSFDFNYLILYC